MKFQNPQLLYALFAIAIPIIIHFFNLRKRTNIRFSNIKFIKSIDKIKGFKNKVKNILILFCRILALLFLIISFCKPFIPNNLNSKYKNKDIIIYIDNSLSMNALDDNGYSLLEVAKKRANSLIKSLKNDNFWIITNDINSARSINNLNNSSVEVIEKINFSAYNLNLNQLISKTSIISNKKKELYIISDMQKNVFNFSNIKEIDTSINIKIIKLKNEITNNISIDSCWSSHPILLKDQDFSIFVKLSNVGDKNINNKNLILSLNGRQKSQQLFNINKNESKIIKLDLFNNDNQLKEGVIEIEDYPIIFDNKLFFTINNISKINIVAINDQGNFNKYISTLFMTDTLLYNFKNIHQDNISYQNLNDKNVLILNEINNFSTELLESCIKIAKKGGSIVVIPPKKINNIINYNKSLAKLNIPPIRNEIISRDQLISKINLSNKLYKNIFNEEVENAEYPTINKYYLFEGNNLQNIINLQDGSLFLGYSSLFSGVSYFFTSPLDSAWNRFSSHSLFVPTLINTALTSVETTSLYYTINRKCDFSSGAKIDISKNLYLTKNNFEAIVNKSYLGKSLSIYGEILKSGAYKLKQNNQNIDIISFNYSSNESNIETITNNEINEAIISNKLKNVETIKEINYRNNIILQKTDKGIELWRISLLFSILFFMIEIMLLKKIKI